jgi:ribosomal protein S18 acetylase RimI-like enzyme
MENVEAFLWENDFKEIVGHCWILKTNDSIEIETLYCSSKYLRKGVGSSLVKYVFSKYPHQNFSIHVAENNIGAIKFYISLGFIVTDEKAMSYKINENINLQLIKMEKLQKI